MLEPAFRRTLQEWEKPNQFPPPAFIRARLINHRLAGEQAWDLVMLIRDKFWHPDIGFLTGCPDIDKATEYALRQVGGYRRLLNVRIDQLDFLRKTFLENHQRFSEEGGAQLRLSTEESAKALDKIRSMSLPSAGTGTTS